MKPFFFLALVCLLAAHNAFSQLPGPITEKLIYDSSFPGLISLKNGTGLSTQGLVPTLRFDEHPYNHNMHITCDGQYYYTINGGGSSVGQISKFDLSGTLIQTYPILIDGRGLSFNQTDSFLYASLFAGDIVKITDLATGTYSTVFSNIMHDAQASFAISPDGTKFYDFVNGTLYVHDFGTGIVIDTLFGLSYGPGNYGGNAAVAVDSNYIYTWDATIKTVSVYDHLGVLVNTMPLDSGDNGHSLSITNNYLFVSRDGNYSVGTWYGYILDTLSSSGPVAGLISSDTAFCEKQCIDFFDMSTNNPTTWQWYFPNASPDTSSLQNPANICYNAYGNYDVSLVTCNGSGCDSLFLPGFITVFQTLPQPQVTQSNDTLFCSMALTYAWYEASNPSLLLSSDSFLVVLQNGNYYVVVSDSNGCVISSGFVLINTGISQDNEKPAWVQCYPNPVSDYIQFGFSDIHVFARLQILNITGQVVLETVIDTQRARVDFKHLNDGIYVLRLISDNRQFLKKMVVSK